MAPPVAPLLAPVRGATPPVVDPPTGRGTDRRVPRRPPAPSLAALAILAILAIGGLVTLAWSMLPQPNGGLLHAPVARTLQGACVTSPSLCGSRVPSP
jgi:hypothetical protein